MIDFVATTTTLAGWLAGVIFFPVHTAHHIFSTIRMIFYIDENEDRCKCWK